MTATTTLTAALIVKNEERFLADCLTSCRAFVDELVVVDTGSTDRTREIAAAAGARVATFPWNGRFDDARNAALELAGGDWILYIDADEVAQAPAPDELRALLSNPALIAGRCEFFPRVGFTAYREVRLFRRDRRIRFRGAIHESVTPDIQRLVAAGVGTVADAPLTIRHYGYEGDLAHKHARNLPLLRGAIEEDPDRLYLHDELGRSLRGLGRLEEARATWTRALDLVRARRGEAPPANDPSESMVYVDLLDLLLAQGEVPRALAEEALACHPDHPQILWLAGRTFLSAGDGARAVAAFERLLGLGAAGPRPVQDVAFDARLFAALPHAGLGRAYTLLRRHDAAARHLLRAAATDPAHAREHLEGAARAQALARRTPGGPAGPAHQD
jgi:hypothetical protein